MGLHSADTAGPTLVPTTRLVRPSILEVRLDYVALRH